jgi:hypothetical protein
MVSIGIYVYRYIGIYVYRCKGIKVYILLLYTIYNIYTYYSYLIEFIEDDPAAAHCPLEHTGIRDVHLEALKTSQKEGFIGVSDKEEVGFNTFYSACWHTRCPPRGIEAYIEVYRY